MNSFSTSDDTMAFLQKYPDIVSDPDLEFVQNKVGCHSLPPYARNVAIYDAC